MGGFAGGDEGGYWDIDTLPASMDKQNNNASKNTHRGKFDIERSDLGYSIKIHTKELYNTISFIPCTCKTFTIEGYNNIPLESNAIYKAFLSLTNFTNDTDIEEFFYTHKVIVTKPISPSANPRENSSDAAAFICLVKEVCNLVLSTDELRKIGSCVNADVPFFINSIV
ncbi:MAG: hypothetical protein Q8N01_05520 [Sulfuricurvum sp.]|nr:hypothetical protein [Sulfuricurvum sp.]MDP3023187.1 hypothetical protein [Sulfuricurvum sp.]MDP3119852.1 hypothetical protein [Sulfuricurvum sp.]